MRKAEGGMRAAVGSQRSEVTVFNQFMPPSAFRIPTSDFRLPISGTFRPRISHKIVTLLIPPPVRIGGTG